MARKKKAEQEEQYEDEAQEEAELQEEAEEAQAEEATFSDDFLAGWFAARSCYQHQNSVPPLPSEADVQVGNGAVQARKEVTDG